MVLFLNPGKALNLFTQTPRPRVFYRSALVLTQNKGDNDPVDAVEISGATYNTGDVIQVKILGTYAMIDEGETDWKVVCINVKDPNADQLNGTFKIELSIKIIFRCF